MIPHSGQPPTTGTSQTTLGDHFQIITTGEHGQQLNEMFRAMAKTFKRRKSRLRVSTSISPTSDSTIGLITQNVNGLSKKKAKQEAWFLHFRQREAAGTPNLVLLQETNVLEGEIPAMHRNYSGAWGFNEAAEGRLFYVDPST